MSPASDPAPTLRPELSELFVELANIGVGRAAAAMSDLAQKEVKISVPSVEVIRLRNAQTSLRLEEGADPPRQPAGDGRAAGAGPGPPEPRRGRSASPA